MIIKTKCENCGKEVESEEYHEVFGLVEQNYKCSHCGFVRAWAYGNLMPEDSEFQAQILKQKQDDTDTDSVKNDSKPLG